MRYLIILLFAASLVSVGCGPRHRNHRSGQGNSSGSNIDSDRPGDKDRLGSRKVNLGGDQDKISALDQGGTFRAIIIEVDNSAMEMWDVEVHFADGSRYSPTTRLHFGSGSWSRQIDLPGEKRKITYVKFRYRSKNIFTGRATLTLWGVR